MTPSRNFRPRPQARRLVALVTSAALLIASCSQSGTGRGTASGSTGVAPTTATGDAGHSDSATTIDDQPITVQPPAQWSDCGSGAKCATIQVPLDHADPDGRKIDIALLRLPAEDPDQRIGSLVINPGGPGASGLGLPLKLMFPRAVRDRFDIVGFDPRGVGQSTALDCHSTLPELYDVDPTMEDDTDVAAYRDVAQRFVDECQAKHADLLPHMGTVDVARDLDHIRAAVGDEQLTYLGYSYGTAIGQQYARLYPTRVRAMVLDGVVDPTVSGLDGAALQAKGFTETLAAFAASCDARGCLSAPTLELIDRVMARAEASPIAAPEADRPATPGVVELAVAQGLYAEMLWTRLARALASADRGDGSGLVAMADLYLSRKSDGSWRNGTEVYFAVNCLDSDWPDSFEGVLAAGKKVAEDNPRLGEAIVNDYARCALWPVDPQPLQPIPTDIEGLAPVVVVSTTGDAATPYESGVAVAERVPGARLITNEGESHTVVAQGNSCVDALISDYLVDLTPPPDQARCG